MRSGSSVWACAVLAAAGPTSTKASANVSAARGWMPNISRSRQVLLEHDRDLFIGAHLQGGHISDGVRAPLLEAGERGEDGSRVQGSLRKEGKNPLGPRAGVDHDAARQLDALGLLGP